MLIYVLKGFAQLATRSSRIGKIVSLLHVYVLYLFCKEFLSFPLLVKTVIRIPKTMYYLQSNKTSNLLYHLTEQKNTKLSQTALKLSNTHNVYAQAIYPQLFG